MRKVYFRASQKDGKDAVSASVSEPGLWNQTGWGVYSGPVSHRIRGKSLDFLKP